MRTIKGMYNMGQYGVWMRGSHITVNRNVYRNEDSTKYYIIWGGQIIEVERGFSGYFHSVLTY